MDRPSCEASSSDWVVSLPEAPVRRALLPASFPGVVVVVVVVDSEPERAARHPPVPRPVPPAAVPPSTTVPPIPRTESRLRARALHLIPQGVHHAGEAVEESFRVEHALAASRVNKRPRLGRVLAANGDEPLQRGVPLHVDGPLQGQEPRARLHLRRELLAEKVGEHHRRGGFGPGMGTHRAEAEVGDLAVAQDDDRAVALAQVLDPPARGSFRAAPLAEAQSHEVAIPSSGRRASSSPRLETREVAGSRELVDEEVPIPRRGRSKRRPASSHVHHHAPDQAAGARRGAADEGVLRAVRRPVRLKSRAMRHRRRGVAPGRR